MGIISALFITAFILSLLHFVYSSILLPDRRFINRSKLFRLRDRLREIKAIEGDKIDDRHFSFMQDYINNSIVILPRMGIYDLWIAYREFKRNAGLRLEIQRRMNILENIEHEEIQNIRRQVALIGLNSMVMNSFMWGFYLVIPIAILFVVLQFANSINNQFKQKAENLVEDIAVTPPNRLGEFTHLGLT